MGSITSLLLLFYGVVTMAAAAVKIVQGQMEGDEIKQLIMGGMFLVVGVVLFAKSRRAQRKAAEET